MDVKKANAFDSIAKPAGLGKTDALAKGGLQSGGGSKNVGPSFQDTLASTMQGGLQAKDSPPLVGGPMGAAIPSGVKFSNHAIERMQSRGVSFNKGDLDRLNQAVDKASAKGSKDTLVLMNDAALIVSVKNKTVVTVMDQAALKENVFTNIDSTIVM